MFQSRSNAAILFFFLCCVSWLSQHPVSSSTRYAPVHSASPSPPLTLSNALPAVSRRSRMTSGVGVMTHRRKPTAPQLIGPAGFGPEVIRHEEDRRRVVRPEVSRHEEGRMRVVRPEGGGVTRSASVGYASERFEAGENGPELFEPIENAQEAVVRGSLDTGPKQTEPARSRPKVQRPEGKGPLGFGPDFVEPATNPPEVPEPTPNQAAAIGHSRKSRPSGENIPEDIDTATNNGPVGLGVSWINNKSLNPGAAKNNGPGHRGAAWVDKGPVNLGAAKNKGPVNLGAAKNKGPVNHGTTKNKGPVNPGAAWIDNGPVNPGAAKNKGPVDQEAAWIDNGPVNPGATKKTGPVDSGPGRTVTGGTNSRRSLARDLRRLSRLLPGTYSNWRQYQQDAYLVSHQRHVLIRSSYRPVQLSFLPNAFAVLVQDYAGESSVPFRQRVHTFSPDPSHKAIRMQVLDFSSKRAENRATRHVERDVQRNNAPRRLRRKDLVSRGSCHMLWRRLHASTFVGTTGKQCLGYVKGEQVRIRVSMTLTRDMLQTKEGWYRTRDGKKLVYTDVPYNLVRTQKITDKSKSTISQRKRNKQSRRRASRRGGPQGSFAQNDLPDRPTHPYRVAAARDNPRDNPDKNHVTEARANQHKVTKSGANSMEDGHIRNPTVQTVNRPETKVSKRQNSRQFSGKKLRKSLSRRKSSKTNILARRRNSKSNRFTDNNSKTRPHTVKGRFNNNNNNNNNNKNNNNNQGSIHNHKTDQDDRITFNHRNNNAVDQDDRTTSNHRNNNAVDQDDRTTSNDRILADFASLSSALMSGHVVFYYVELSACDLPQQLKSSRLSFGDLVDSFVSSYSEGQGGEGGRPDSIRFWQTKLVQADEGMSTITRDITVRSDGQVTVRLQRKYVDTQTLMWDQSVTCRLYDQHTGMGGVKMTWRPADGVQEMTTFGRFRSSLKRGRHEVRMIIDLTQCQGRSRGSTSIMGTTVRAYDIINGGRGVEVSHVTPSPDHVTHTLIRGQFLHTGEAVFITSVQPPSASPTSPSSSSSSSRSSTSYDHSHVFMLHRANTFRCALVGSDVTDTNRPGGVRLFYDAKT